MSKTLERIKTNQKVKDAWSEGDDGYWVELAKGYISNYGTHSLHEFTLRNLSESLRNVETCNCGECFDGLVDCEFCDHRFPEELGRYGCPNCLGK